MALEPSYKLISKLLLVLFAEIGDLFLLVPHGANDAGRWPLLIQALAAGDGGSVLGTLVLLERSEEGTGGTTARLGGSYGSSVGGGCGGDGVRAISLWCVHVHRCVVVFVLFGSGIVCVSRQMSCVYICSKDREALWLDLMRTEDWIE